MSVGKPFIWRSIGLTLATLKPCCILGLVLSTTSAGAATATLGHRMDALLLWLVAVPLLLWSLWDFIRGLVISRRRGMTLNATLLSVKAIVLVAAILLTGANIAGLLPWQHHAGGTGHEQHHDHGSHH